MAVFCGNDIIKISRVKDTIEKLGETFTKRVYTEQEINYCESRRMCKYQSYAARFAAKEAAFKAISKILNDKYSVCWKDFEIINDKQGRPQINLLNVDTDKIQSIDVSISHCKLYATANVVVVLV